MESLGGVRYAIRRGRFTGYCYRDRLLGKERTDRLPRPPHPQVDWSDTRIETVRRQRLTRVAVVCPICGVRRYTHPGAVAAKIRSGGFTGRCKSCIQRRQWTVLSPGRAIEPGKGYIRLTGKAIATEDRWLYNAMRGPRTTVLEHRMVMARQLGRPLTTNELVDHRDGNKINNDPANLRLYRRGRNDDGSGSGYGTFYDEWQRAEARIRELEALLNG